MRGLRTGKTIQGIFTVTKTAALGGLILLGFVVGANAVAIKANLAAFWKASWTHMAGGQIVSVEPLTGLMVLAAIAVDLLVFKTKYTFPGLLIVLLGIPVYLVRKRTARTGGPAGD